MEKKIHENKEGIKGNMNKNKEGIENNMNEIKGKIKESMISMAILLLERPPRRGVEIQRNHEHKENHVVKNQLHMGCILSQLESTNV